MKVNITYPPVTKRKLQRKRVLMIARWPMLFAAFICPVINLVTGGKAWSVIVLMSLYMVWTLGFATDLVEYNRISQFIKLITETCILLILIDVLLAPGWAIEVVPSVCFGGFVVVGILFFTDLRRQKQNMLPMLSMIFLALISSIVGLILWHEESRWALAIMGAFAFALLVACIVILKTEFVRELKRRFHVK